MRLKHLKQICEVWQFEVTLAPSLLKQGRKKYERLMKAYVQQQARPAMPAVPLPTAQPWGFASTACK